MTAEKYKRVKEIFLAACELPRHQRAAYVAQQASGDAEIASEVESLLSEHQRESQLLPSEPVGPLGPMSALLSHAGIKLGDPPAEDENLLDVSARGESQASPHPAHGAPAAPDRHAATHYLDDDAHDQTSGSRSGIVDAGRFMAGTVVAERYRIIEMLGRGGMGEVYRADDLTLNQSVALKFLPALFGSDAKWLERFRNEVRLARQVTHPNVCRVFDIGEFQGEQFISMEYVDGENLASLLRRIGRVPHDKAVLLARQLCAGLSSAHDRGVLHRDLKPANVMIDGRGSVRITDFGLAAPVDQLRTEAVRAGTPAYMSPEQLAGRPITVRSDVYSLGLVLYEMFTGRRTFRADSLRAYQKMHTSEEPTPPSEIVEDIDPIVERVIMRCLEKDPKDRPASAMAVSAALPGGNPLREILAAGETPSPEVVAAAGETQGVMKPRLAIALLVTALLCVIGFVVMAPSAFVVQRAISQQLKNDDLVRAEPAVLVAKAQEMLRRDLGYPGLPRDVASGFDIDRGYYLHIEQDPGTDKGKSRLWRLSRPRQGLVYFWYRQSPQLLVPLSGEGTVTERDPAPEMLGSPSDAALARHQILVQLDPLGRLIGLEVEPSVLAQESPAQSRAPTSRPQSQSAATAEKPPETCDWNKLLELAGVDPARGNFTPTEPRGVPPVFADQRMAWIGSFDSIGHALDRNSSINNETVRIEAAAYRGKPVFFAVIGEWREIPESQRAILSVGPWNLLIQTPVIAALLLVGGWMAWKNYRSGRGDRIGATRMALAFFVLGFLGWLLAAHHVPDMTDEFILFRRGMGPVLYAVCLIWIFYMALEPWVRRVWPETVISWSRLLAGKWFDPMVGRDVLAGAAIGVMTTLLAIIEYQLPQWLGEDRLPVPLPSMLSAQAMLNATTHYFASLLGSGMSALYNGLILLLALVLVRMATSRRWLSSTLAVALFTVATAHYRLERPWLLGAENALSMVIQALLALTLLLLLSRHGLVALIFCLLVRMLLMDFPVTWDLSAWYANASLAGILATVVILGTSFYIAMGGRPVLNVRLEE